jgi:hypothetical protein
MIGWLRWALVCAVVGTAPVAAAADQDIPAEKLGLIVLRVLAYDHDLASRAGDRVTVAVIEGPGEPARACAGTMTATFTGLASKVTVGRLPVRAVRIPLAEPGPLAATLRRERAVAAYACVGSGDAAALARATRGAAALSFTTDGKAVAHLAVGLMRRPDRIDLEVNLAAARGEAVQLSAAFLRIVKVVQR